MSKQWDARFAGDRRGLRDKTKHEPRRKDRITVFAQTRDEAMDEVKRAADLYGYDNVVIEHITKN